MNIELVAPVGSFEMLAAAINAGADAVYLGIKGFNMRAGARNFSVDELQTAVSQAHKNNVKVYLVLNTIIFEDELDKIKTILKTVEVDAIIAWDHAIIKLANELGIKVHLSTQASVSNSIAINEYKKLGISRVVLARECTLKEIKQISTKTEVELEAFCHGAMCVAQSGRCFISEHLYGKSANRGECVQPCRREYKLVDTESGKELSIGNNYVMSAKDLCTVKFLDKLIDAGITVLKIEGRARSAEYVSTVVKTYKQALLFIKDGTYEKHKNKLAEELKNVYNRDFSDGFYFGRPIEDFWNSSGGNAKFRKEYIGIILNYYPKAKALHAIIHTGKLDNGDDIYIIGPTTGVVELKIKSIRNEENTFTVACESKVREGDKVYKKVRNKIIGNNH